MSPQQSSTSEALSRIQFESEIIEKGTVSCLYIGVGTPMSFFGQLQGDRGFLDQDTGQAQVTSD